MATLMCKDAPPAAEDRPMLAKMVKVGLEPCKAVPAITWMPGKIRTSLDDL